MNSAKFKTIREALGLTAQWVANTVGVTLRTVECWEEGRMAVPDTVERVFDDIDKKLEAAIAQTLKQVDAMIQKNGVPAEITLVRYRTDEDLWKFRPDMKPLPASTHAVMLSRLRRALLLRGIPSVTKFMEPDEYLRWLAGRKDTEAERSAWAVTQFQED